MGDSAEIMAAFERLALAVTTARIEQQNESAELKTIWAENLRHFAKFATESSNTVALLHDEVAELEKERARHRAQITKLGFEIAKLDERLQVLESRPAYYGDGRT